MALRMVMDKATGFVAKFYQRGVASQLTQTGKFNSVLTTCIT